MLDLEAIFIDNAARRAELEAEAARLEAARQAALKGWEAECDKLRTALLSQAAAKAEAWLRANLIRPEELLRFEEFTNGLVLHIKMEDAADEEREWEICFLFYFGGESPDSLSVKWADVHETRKSIESYYPCDY